MHPLRLPHLAVWFCLLSVLWCSSLVLLSTSSPISYQIHSYDDLRQWPNVLQKGARWFKLDFHFMPWEFCAQNASAVSRVDITRAAHGCFLLTHDAPLPNRPTAYNTSDDVLDMIEGAGLPSHPMHEYFWHIESETSVDDGVSADSSNDSARLRGDNDQDDNVWIALCFKYDYGSPCDGSEMALNWTRTIDAFYQRAQALVTQPHALMRPGATSNDRDGQLISPRTKEHGDTEIIIYSDSGSGLIAEDVEIREEIIQNLRAGKKNAKDRNSYFTQHESYLYDKMSVSGEEKEGPEAEEMRGIGGKGRARLRRKPFVLQGAMNSGRLIGRSRCKARFTLDGAATPTGNACLAQRWRPWVAGFCVNRDDFSIASSNNQSLGWDRIQINNMKAGESAHTITRWLDKMKAIQYGKFAKSVYPFLLWEPDDQADILAIIEAYLDGGVPVHEPGFRFAINVDPVQFSVSAARLSVQKQRSRRGQRRQENRKEGNAVGEAGNVRQRKGDKDRAVPVPKSVTAWNIELPSTEEATQPHVVVFPSFKPPIHASGFVHTSNSEGSDVSAKHNSTVSTTEKRNPGNDRDNRRKESSENEEHLGENILVTAFHRDCRLLYQASILNRIMQPTPPSLLPAFKRGPLQLTLPPSFYLSTALPSTSNSGSSSCTLDVNTFTRVQPPYTYLSARTSKRIQSLIAVGDSRHSLAIYQLDDLGVDESNEDENGSIGTLQLLHNSSFPCHGDSVSRGFAVSYLPVSGSGDDESKSLLFLHSISTSECGLLVQAFKLRVDASASPSSPVGDPVCISQSLDVEGGVSLSLHRLDRDNDIGADKGNIFRNRVHEEHREQWGEARERKKSAKDVCRHRNSSYIGLVSFASSSKDLYLSYVCMSAANDGVVYAAPSVRIGVGSAPSVDLMNSPTISSRHHRGNYYRRQEEQLQSQVSFSSFSPSLMVSIVASDGYCFNHHKANTQATPPICETEPYSVNTVLSYTYAPLINLLAAVYDDNESNDVDTDNDMGGGKSIHRQEFGPPTVDNESGIRLDRVSIIDPCTKGVLHGTYDFGANPSNALYIGPSASSNEMEIGLIAVHEGVNARSETTFTRNSSTMDDNSIDDETGGVCGTAVEFDGLIIDAWPLSPF